MAEPLGWRLYRGLLKTCARVWNPTEIRDMDVLRKVLAQMQSGERGLRRLEEPEFRARLCPRQPHLSPAAVKAGLGPIGWHTLRHTYRAWLGDNGEPLTVQKELMGHASIQTTLNTYG